MSARAQDLLQHLHEGGKYVATTSAPNEYDMIYLVALQACSWGRPPGDRNLVQIGVDAGHGSVVLADVARRMGGRLHDVDIDECRMARDRVKAEGLESFRVFHQMDQVEFVEFWDHPSSGRVVFAWEDGSHAYPHTLRTLLGLDRILAPEGVIAVHDTGLEPVARSLEEFHKERPGYDRFTLRDPAKAWPGLEFMMKVA